MATVRHPAFERVTLDVTEGKLAEHLEQGWLLVEPEPDGDGGDSDQDE